MSRGIWRLDKVTQQIPACSEPRLLACSTVPFSQNTKPELDSTHQRVGRVPRGLALVSLLSLSRTLTFCTVWWKLITSDEQKRGGRRKRGVCAGGSACPAGGAAWLRLGRGGRVGAGGEPGREPRHPSTYTPYPLVFPFPGLDLQAPTLACSALLRRTSVQALSPAPLTLEAEGGGLDAAPAQLGRGTGWETQAEISASWGRGVSSLPVPGVGSLGRGLGRGGSELEPCLPRRCRVEQMAGEGRGYVAGRRRGAGAAG